MAAFFLSYFYVSTSLFVVKQTKNSFKNMNMMNNHTLDDVLLIFINKSHSVHPHPWSILIIERSPDFDLADVWDDLENIRKISARDRVGQSIFLTKLTKLKCHMK